MAIFLMILTIVFAVLTLASLMAGVVSMGKAGEFNRKYGNKLMRLRVFFQLATVACLVLTVLAYQAG
ncbi:twin transmembrane helix small protein [Dongia deserti]|uniref:twin transmembrane helix small protein n=1 Tax=Dongia deserti TaxID=2268030 RepID=UPI0025494FBE|nr:twin transmembrane helix small protein [Dongia deserti]